MKNCKNCGKAFEEANTRQIWCSNGCKQDNHRKKHNLPKPSFLSGTETPKEPSLMEGAKGGLRFGQIVEKPAVNEQQIIIRGFIVGIEQELALLEEKRKGKVSEYTRLCNQYPEVVFALMGGAVGGVIIDKAFNSTAATIGGALLFGWLGYQLGNDLKSQTNSRVAKRLADLAKELELINTKKTQLEVKLNAYRYEFQKAKNLPVQEQKIEAAPAPQLEQAKLPELALQTRKRVSTTSMEKAFTADEVRGMTFETWKFGGVFGQLFGQPEHGFYAGIYGAPGQGKTTLAISLGKYLSENLGSVLLVSSEMGISEGLRSILERTNVKGEYFTIKNAKGLKYEDLRQVINATPTPFVIIDSVNDLNLTAEQIEALRIENKKKSFISIFQATKNGDFKGGNEHAHNLDIKIRVESGEAIAEKNRFAALSRLPL
jgi:hypothetical protein